MESLKNSSTITRKRDSVTSSKSTRDETESYSNVSDVGLINDLMKTLPQIEKIVDWAWKVVPYNALPHWLKDNDYLLFHHRPPMYSVRGCVKSIFRMHTQTWNIWTHLIGFVFFVFLTFSVYCFRDYITHLFEEKVTISDLPWKEQVIVFFFFLGAMTCLFCSTTFHTLCNHSEKLNVLWSRLDYSGIAFLITGSNIPAYYYSFYCRPFPRDIHIIMISILCAACIITSVWNEFHKPGYRPLRFAVFVSFGFYGIIPVIQVWLEKGIIEPYWSFFTGLTTMAFLYTAGATLYVLRIPERFNPGFFDVWAHSHQLFHICVVIAALVHYHTLVLMIKSRYDFEECKLYSFL